MRNIHYPQELHSKIIASSQVFTIRFSLELKLLQYIGLIDPLISVDHCISPVLIYVISGYYLGTNITYTELWQVSKLKRVFFSILLVNR